jgi:hypothetical protein
LSSVGALVWNTVVHRIPALESHEENQDKSIDGKFADMGGNMDKQFAAVQSSLSTMDGRVQQQLNRMDLAIKGLKVKLARICNQQRISNPSTCNPDALVADVKSATQAQAQFFDSAQVTLDHGSVPVVMTPGLKEQLPTYTFASSYTFKASANNGDKAEMAKAILWSSAAADAHWHQSGNSVVVVFSNGTATFDLSSPTTTEHVGELVQSLNATTEALKTSPPVAAEKK